jgi:hypothetical protein
MKPVCRTQKAGITLVRLTLPNLRRKGGNFHAKSIYVGQEQATAYALSSRQNKEIAKKGGKAAFLSLLK